MDMEYNSAEEANIQEKEIVISGGKGLKKPKTILYTDACRTAGRRSCASPPTVVAK